MAPIHPAQRTPSGENSQLLAAPLGERKKNERYAQHWFYMVAARELFSVPPIEKAEGEGSPLTFGTLGGC